MDVCSAAPDRLWLIGFSGSGKSTVGPLLAQRLHRRFVDTDQIIVKQTRQSIASLFSQHGERYFRQMESAVIARLASFRQSHVISLGGGAFQSAANRALIRRSGRVIYLQASPRTILKRLSAHADRPLLQVSPGAGESLRQARLARIETMLKRREPKYRRADIVIITDHLRPTEIANRICAKIEGLHDHH